MHHPILNRSTGPQVTLQESLMCREHKNYFFPFLILFLTLKTVLLLPFDTPTLFSFLSSSSSPSSSELSSKKLPLEFLGTFNLLAESAFLGPFFFLEAEGTLLALEEEGRSGSLQMSSGG